MTVREKYVEERYGRWCVFGEHADGTVDVNDGTNDVVTCVDRAEAEKLIAAHNQMVAELVRLYNLLPADAGWERRPDKGATS